PFLPILHQHRVLLAGLGPRPVLASVPLAAFPGDTKPKYPLSDAERSRARSALREWEAERHRRMAAARDFLAEEIAARRAYERAVAEARATGFRPHQLYRRAERRNLVNVFADVRPPGLRCQAAGSRWHGPGNPGDRHAPVHLLR